MGSLSQKDRASPELRFPDYSEDWDNIRLKDTADIKRGAGSQYLTYVQTEKDGVRLIRIGDFLGSDPVFVEDTKDMARFRLQRDDILIAGTGATAGITFKVPEAFIDFAFSYNAPRIRVKNSESDFVISYLKSEIVLRQQHRLFTGNAQPFLDTAAIGGFKLRVPTLPEQRKIADFLTAVDGRIGQLIQKKALLEDYKKGVMQQLFTQAIRFKDDHGNDFPDWEEKGIGNSIEMLSGFPFPSEEILDGKSTNGRPSILLMRGVNITEGSIRHSPDQDRFYCGDIAKLEKYKLVVGDMVIGMDGSKVGKNSAIVGEAEAGALLVQRVARIRPVAGVSLRYIYQHINSFVFHRYVDRVKTSSGIPHISAKQIREFKIGFPCFPEQTKIADFLSAIDRKIESVATQITETQTFKRGLLQQMFV